MDHRSVCRMASVVRDRVIDKIYFQCVFGLDRVTNKRGYRA